MNDTKVSLSIHYNNNLYQYSLKQLALTNTEFKCFSFGLNMREIKWCPFDPQSVEWTGDYTDAMFLHLDK